MAVKPTTDDTTNEWYTPRWIIDALGGQKSFDLDPTAPYKKHYTAKKCYTEKDDGLKKPWKGRVFLNPPYSAHVIDPFIEKLARHGNGVALVNTKTDTKWFHRITGVMSGMFLFEGRVPFDRPGVSVEGKGSGGFPSMLLIFGDANFEVVRKAMAAGKLNGALFARPLTPDEEQYADQREKSIPFNIKKLTDKQLSELAAESERIWDEFEQQQKKLVKTSRERWASIAAGEKARRTKQVAVLKKKPKRK